MLPVHAGSQDAPGRWRPRNSSGRLSGRTSALHQHLYAVTDFIVAVRRLLYHSVKAFGGRYVQCVTGYHYLHFAGMVLDGPVFQDDLGLHDEGEK